MRLQPLRLEHFDHLVVKPEDKVAQAEEKAVVDGALEIGFRFTGRDNVSGVVADKQWLM